MKQTVWAELVGLRNQAELNGTVVRVLGWDDELAIIDGVPGQEQTPVRRSNLRLLPRVSSSRSPVHPKVLPACHKCTHTRLRARERTHARTYTRTGSRAHAHAPVRTPQRHCNHIQN